MSKVIPTGAKRERCIHQNVSLPLGDGITSNFCSVCVCFSALCIYNLLRKMLYAVRSLIHHPEAASSTKLMLYKHLLNEGISTVCLVLQACLYAFIALLLIITSYRAYYYYTQKMRPNSEITKQGLGWNLKPKLLTFQIQSFLTPLSTKVDSYSHSQVRELNHLCTV